MFSCAGAATVLASLFAGCVSTGSQRAEHLPSWAPSKLDDGLAVASAQDGGPDACLLHSMTAAIRRGGDYAGAHVAPRQE